MKRAALISVIILSAIIIAFAYIFYYTELLYFGACTEEGMVCPDGTGVGRQGLFCRFEKCPDLVYCNANSQCPEDMKCINFPKIEKSYCAKEFYWTIGLGSVCYRDCGSHDGCELIESDPLKIVCK